MPILGSQLVHGPFDLKDKKNMGQMVYQTVGHLWSRKHVFYLLGITLQGGGGENCQWQLPYCQEKKCYARYRAVRGKNENLLVLFIARKVSFKTLLSW